MHNAAMGSREVHHHSARRERRETAARNRLTSREYLKRAAAQQSRAKAHSWIVVAIAPVSLGLLTFVAFWYAAVRMYSKVVALCAAGYTAATVLEVVWAGPDDAPPAPGFGPMIGLTMLVGTLHLALIRSRLEDAICGEIRDEIVTSPAAVPGRPRGAAKSRAALPARPRVVVRPPEVIVVDPLEEDPTYVEAVRHRARREQVRALVASDPALATELRVGRPDLQRTFDDGGLVDVNAVPATVIARLPGFTRRFAQEMEKVREHLGHLSSAEELVVYGSVPLDVLERVRDLLLFRPTE
jgi:hypothetical protein